MPRKAMKRTTYIYTLALALLLVSTAANAEEVYRESEHGWIILLSKDGFDDTRDSFISKNSDANIKDSLFFLCGDSGKKKKNRHRF